MSTPSNNTIKTFNIITKTATDSEYLQLFLESLISLFPQTPVNLIVISPLFDKSGKVRKQKTIHQSYLTNTNFKIKIASRNELKKLLAQSDTSSLFINLTSISLPCKKFRTNILDFNIVVIGSPLRRYLSFMTAAAKVKARLIDFSSESYSEETFDIQLSLSFKYRKISKLVALNAPYLVFRAVNYQKDKSFAVESTTKKIDNDNLFTVLGFGVMCLIQPIKQHLFTRHFSIAYVNDRIDAMFSANKFHLNTIKTNKCEFLADPFIYRSTKPTVLFAEYIEKPNEKGKIVSLNIDDCGIIAQKKTLLESSYHMSYPFIYESDRQTFLIPESSEARTTTMFEVKQNPADESSPTLTKTETLLAGQAIVDPTIIRFGMFYWLFCGAVDKLNDVNTKLFLYYSEDGQCNWKAHPKNPVVIDASRARPAGTPFFYQGRLYRPSQDCLKAYGKRLVINEVLSLTPTSYLERPIAVIEPDHLLRIKQIHHIAYKDSLLVFDYLVNHIKFSKCNANKPITLKIKHLL
jgi:hypothetical protein